MPVWASVLGGALLLVNGWFAYSASSSKELMEARNEALAIQLQKIKDRLEARVVFLEQGPTASTSVDGSLPDVALRTTATVRRDGGIRLGSGDRATEATAAHGG